MSIKVLAFIAFMMFFSNVAIGDKDIYDSETPMKKSQNLEILIPGSVGELRDKAKALGIEWRPFVGDGAVLKGDFDLTINLSNTSVNVFSEMSIYYVTLTVDENKIRVVSVECVPESMAYDLDGVLEYAKKLSNNILSLGFYPYADKNINTLESTAEYYEISKKYRSLNLGVLLYNFRKDDVGVSLAVNRVHSASEIYTIDRSAPLSEPSYRLVLTLGVIKNKEQ